MATPTDTVPDSNGNGSDDELYLERFTVHKVLGEGSYGKVKLCYDTTTHRMVALKIVPKVSLKKTAHVTRLKREVRIMRLLHHPNITRLYEVIETEHQIVLVMEHVEGGELFDYIVAQKRLKDRIARRLFRQMIGALEYCHKSSIIHRDLKPENILLDQDKNIKIIDFGFVKLFEQTNCLQTFCGSPFYASPEMIIGKEYSGPEVDIWSMGVILFALLNGYLPFKDANTQELYRKISTGTYEMQTRWMNEASSDLIKRMLTVEPSQRATMDEIKHHRWVTEDDGSEQAPITDVPPRAEFIDDPDPYLLGKFAMYGMDRAAAEASLAAGERGPAWGLYHLLAEHEVWEKGAAEERTGVDSGNVSGRTSVNASHAGLVENNLDGSGHNIRNGGSMARPKFQRRLSLGRPTGLNSGNNSPLASPGTLGKETNPFDSPRMSMRRRASMMERDAVPHGGGPQNGAPATTTTGLGAASILKRRLTLDTPARLKERAETAAASLPRRLSRPETVSLPRDSPHTSLHTSATPVYVHASLPRKSPPPGAPVSSTHTSGSIPIRSTQTVSGVSYDSVSSGGNTYHRSARLRSTAEGGIEEGNEGVYVPKRRASAVPEQGSPRLPTNTESRPKSTTKSPDRRPSVSRISLNLSTLHKKLFKKSSSTNSTPSTAGADTTSTKPAADIIAEICRVMELNGVEQCTLSATRIQGTTRESVIEVELCRLKGTNMHALQMKRIKGTSVAYQTLCQTLISQWHI
ncbi:kinase-like domain-containing protein [Fimicolochytrium jonesii]|uniref:kinase-like domain-containing protein n=1 Tax=Fimicolochytrium jonesii TaxID=1396493 RepID=UPI0022FF4290|nr:kinase-like domain-containing protein [Fimicolochytrium jonesii]KAI8817281.1 kinase-like domain-containing protein [Fimicolochytrium jonesii]